MELIISEEHGKALKVINESYYERHCKTLGEVVEEMIEEHLLRENDRLGNIKNGKYIDPLAQLNNKDYYITW